MDEYIATLPDADEPRRLDAAAPVGAYWFPFSMRGFENGLMDLYSELENMHRLLDAIHDYSMPCVAVDNTGELWYQLSKRFPGLRSQLAKEADSKLCSS